MEVVAEGVETQQHVDALRELGCQYAQGYLFHRPVEAGRISALLD
jgi:EAL domain-containing protein (putative c-di-GMP-specific phosphodiesterase class I)